MIKQIGLIVSCLITIIFYSIHSVEGSNGEYKLEEMIEIAEKNQISITSWQGYLKADLGTANSDEEVKKIVENTKDEFPFINEWITHEPENHHVTVEAKINKQVSSQLHKIQIYVTESNDRYQMFLTIQFKDNALDSKGLHSIVDNINVKIDKEYYTISGYLEGKPDLKETTTKLMNGYGADFIEGVQEKGFHSISGYTSKWEESIPAKNNKEVNVQMGLRYSPDQERTNVTIGTPIIITEY
ncbi:YwmB family TATA-box binding protein [Metabacillus litoralis]|uniref:YwmB family TATA-box binding protein n=1 Tax=Metabacillus TaxID=2675233 RepID=UPI001BA1635D|nr:YwmB family TATA-box binding protein [Metabacillus litoralis]UHA61672.1 YwmB family TATA-box binding protein [Metabacillus litoralis]